MAIIYDQNNALKPPILNGITEINSPDSLTLNVPNVLTFNAVDTSYLGGSYNILVQGFSLNAENNCILNAINGVFFGNQIYLIALTTAEILTLNAIPGGQVFCSTINQMVFYQVSPITGITLGWYNSTGTIQL